MFPTRLEGTHWKGHRLTIGTPLPKNQNGVIPAAYVGVTGERFRVRVPVQEIKLKRLEGVIDPTEHSFNNWHGASWFLATQAKMAPANGCYDKFRFSATWANGFEYCGRFDLVREIVWPSIENHIQGTLRWMLDAGAHLVKADDQRTAKFMLEALDLGQAEPSPAPQNWAVIRDYQERSAQLGEPSISDVVYGLAAAA